MNKVIFPIVASVGFLAILLLFLAGMGYQQQTFELGQAFGYMQYSAYAGIASVVLVIVYSAWKRPKGSQLIILLISAMAGGSAFYLPYQQQQIVQSVPPIHDITSDTVNPPAFVAVVPLRADAQNPVEYLGGDVTQQQLAAYPDIATIIYSQSPAQVFAAATGIVNDMGWELVDANESDGRIEATATTRWFGFKDDVVIRIKAGQADSSIFDIRSKSRVGRSDVGANAKRIRAFTAALDAQMGN